MSAAAEVDRILADPVGYCRDVLGIELWSKQREILEALRDNDQVAVKSGNSTGKTAAAGAAVLCWLAGGPGSIAITTAPTERQVKKLLWREIRRRYRASGGKDGPFRDGKLTDLELFIREDWYAAGFTSDAGTPDPLQGSHEARVLVVVDEASGVPEPIFEAIDGILASGEGKLLLLGNPLRSGGSFGRAFGVDRADWARVSMSAFDTPAFTGEQVSPEVLRRLVQPRWVDRMRRKWGEASPLWQARVLGEFPTSADNTVMPIGAVEAAQARELKPTEPVVVAVDVARFGSDETVIAARRGPRVRLVDMYVGKDLMKTVGRTLRVARELGRQAHMPAQFMWIVVDDAGLGGGVTDRLREIGEFPILGFNGGEKAVADDDYPNARSEAWFRFAEALPTLDLDRDEQLAADLTSPEYDVDSKGRRVVEPKAQTKRRLGRSPDRADAALLTLVPRRASFVDQGLGSGDSITGDLLRRVW